MLLKLLFLATQLGLGGADSSNKLEGKMLTAVDSTGTFLVVGVIQDSAQSEPVGMYILGSVPKTRQQVSWVTIEA